MRRDFAAAAALSLAALCAAFWPLITTGRFLIAGDAWCYSHPLRTLAFASLRDGQVPAWTPHLLSGYPLASMAQLALAYPLTWGYFLDPLWGEQIVVLAPFLLTPLFTWLYARRVGLGGHAALLAGFGFAYGGFMAGPLAFAGQISHPGMWLPLALLAVDGASRGRAMPGLLVATAAVTLAVLSGQAQFFVYMAYVVVAYGACLSLGARGAGWRPVAVSVGAVALAAGLCAFQILETRSAVAESFRAVAGFERVAGGVPLEGLLSALIAPAHLLGDTSSAIAPLLLLLAVLGAATGARALRQGNPRPAFWALVAVLGVVLMMGRHTPLHPFLYRLPALSLFPPVHRHGMEVTFALSMLAAYGWDALARRVPASGGSRALAAGAAMLLLGLGACAGEVSAAVQPLVLGPYLAWRILSGLLLLGALAALLRSGTGRATAGLLAVLVVIPTVADAYPQIRLPFPLLHTAEVLRKPSAMTRRMAPLAAEGRVYTVVFPEAVQTLDPLPVDPINRSSMFGLREAAGYEPLIPMRYARVLGDVGRSGIANPPLAEAAALQPWSHALDILNVTHVIKQVGTFPEMHAETTWGPAPGAPRGGTLVLEGTTATARGARLVIITEKGAWVRNWTPQPGSATSRTSLPVDGLWEVRVQAMPGFRLQHVGFEEGRALRLLRPTGGRWKLEQRSDGIEVHRNRRALPRAWFVSTATVMDDERALARVRGQGPLFDPTVEALVDDAVPAIQDARGRWRLVSESADRIELETRTGGQALLVVSERHAPGWEARVDGRPVPLLRADYLLRAVAVPAGVHTVEMRYAAPGLRAGAWVSLGTAFLLALLGLAHAVRQRSGAHPR